MIFFFNWVNFRFHVNFQGCMRLHHSSTFQFLLLYLFLKTHSVIPLYPPQLKNHGALEDSKKSCPRCELWWVWKIPPTPQLPAVETSHETPFGVFKGSTGEMPQYSLPRKSLPPFSKWWSRWWVQIFVIFTPIWGRFPFWLIFFGWVETTN